MVVLTPQEEAKLMDDYSKICWKLVHRFSQNKGSSIFDMDDLYQECMLALVKHMHKCEEKSQLRRIQIMDLVNAMARFVLKNQVVRLDANRTDKIKQILANVAKKQSVDLLKEDDLCKDPIEALISRMDYELFEAVLSPMEREVLRKRGEGFKGREIASALGCSHQCVFGCMSRAKHKYEAFAS